MPSRRVVLLLAFLLILVAGDRAGDWLASHYRAICLSRRAEASVCGRDRPALSGPAFGLFRGRAANR